MSRMYELCGSSFIESPVGRFAVTCTDPNGTIAALNLRLYVTERMLRDAGFESFAQIAEHFNRFACALIPGEPDDESIKALRRIVL